MEQELQFEAVGVCDFSFPVCHFKLTFPTELAAAKKT
jgi:hypothetical protein